MNDNTLPAAKKVLCRLSISTNSIEGERGTYLSSFRIIMLFWQRVSLVLLEPTISLIKVGQFLGHSYGKPSFCRLPLGQKMFWWSYWQYTSWYLQFAKPWIWGNSIYTTLYWLEVSDFSGTL